MWELKYVIYVIWFNFVYLCEMAKRSGRWCVFLMQVLGCSSGEENLWCNQKPHNSGDVFWGCVECMLFITYVAFMVFM